MSRKSARQQQALQRERERRQSADQRRFEQQQAAADAGVERPPIAPARDLRARPDSQQAQPSPTLSTRVGAGRRTPGQQVACGWCGQPVVVKARGPLPKWCSPACRHRAWEQDRAAASGCSAVAVVDRYIIAVPDTGPGWIEQLHVLTGQISAGPRPIADSDLDQLTAALQLAQGAITNRTRWRGGQHHY